jgi:uncharacterized protein YbcC (UPF0753/DUF2309 family)
VHHNTLHAFEHLPFHEAVATASALFDAQPYLSEEQYREHYARGRITDDDLDAALAATSTAEILGPLSRAQLDRLALRVAIRAESPASLRWKIDELGVTQRLHAEVDPATRTRFLERSRRWITSLLDQSEFAPSALAEMLGTETDTRSLRTALARDPEALAVGALWAQCRRLRRPAPGPARPAPWDRVGLDRTPRDLLHALTGEDPSDLVHPVLIRLCAAYFDEGMAHWSMPERAQGLFRAWRALRVHGRGPVPAWLEGLDDELRRSEQRGLSAQDTVLAALDELGIDPAHWEPFLTRVLLQLPGWAGMVHRLAHHPSDRRPDAPPASLMDLLAVRLSYDRYAWRDVARRRLGFTGPLHALAEHARRTAPSTPSATGGEHDEAWRFFQLAQLAGLTGEDVRAMPVEQRLACVARLDAFDELARRRVWHDAYERHYRDEVLQGLAENLQRPLSERSVQAPRFQALFCIDDREEGIRRHLEELTPEVETFGLAGFFGLAIEYRALDEGAAVALCPVGVTPAHEILEHPDEAHTHLATARARLRARFARAMQFIHRGSRSLVGGALLTPTLGLFAPLALLARVLFPRASARLREATRQRLLPAPRTRLRSVRRAEPPRASLEAPGFTVSEQAERVATMLENIGLTERFARLVVVLGHGSASVNNPHYSAYDCGACGGRNGGPNARLFAQMANRPEVRAALRARGLALPDSTWFVGALHNTATEEITFFDLEAVPASHVDDFSAMRRALDAARRMSAHERCRRFEHAPENVTPAQALAHVEERAEDISQARPELGHVSNAMCVVGRRALTRGLFLDRRAFLVSYDPQQDDDLGTILERVLLAAAPVGAGISLEYFFSCVDNARYGAGTKAPHNLTALLGVMDGASSDLRTGLPLQMIEIHEPMRLLVIVEAAPTRLAALAARQPVLQTLIGRGWIQLVSLEPETRALTLFTPSGFVPWTAHPPALPRVSSSPAWYRGKSTFVPPALIVPPSRAAQKALPHAS